MKHEGLCKDEFLTHWNGLEPGKKIAPDAVPYKHEGSTYDEDGIRITGSRAFIDSVLSNLKQLLNYENGLTRLQVVYKKSEAREGKPLHRAALVNSYNCYIQVHQRGREAAMYNMMAGQAFMFEQH